MSNAPLARIDPDSPAPETALADRPAQGGERLGDILRRVREHKGETINGIAQYLCIRPNYLVALEKSRYGDLPADAYVVGFLRSYAGYLGLDEQGAIDQYRREMAGRRRKPQLSMPQPMTEGRAPTVAFLVGSALAALLVYGIWYGLSTPDRATLEAPPPIPAQTQNPAPAPSTEPVVAPVPAPIPDTSATEKNVQETPEIPPEKPGESSVFLENTKLPDIKETSPVLIEGETRDNKTPNTPKPQESAHTAAVPLSTTNMFGETAKARVVLRAVQESWVLVTDEKGLTVFDKTLRPGDSYGVPAMKNLKLTTGNPEGLEIALDGLALPKIQSTEKVARGVPLDPFKLRPFLSGKKNAQKEKEKEDDGNE